jgi:hypothetical protein
MQSRQALNEAGILLSQYVRNNASTDVVMLADTVANLSCVVAHLLHYLETNKLLETADRMDNA